MNIKKITYSPRIAILVLALSIILSSNILVKNARAEAPNTLVTDATCTLKQLMTIPDRRIPDQLLASCRGLAIFPHVYQAGFLVGGGYGEGILVVKDPSTNRWKGPVFLKMAMGSFGWQIGIKSTNLVLVIMNQQGITSFLQNNFTLGADLSVAAGPVGRNLSASTDILLRASIYSYSRSKGFFAGAYIQGAALGQDYSADKIYYGHEVNPRTIILKHGPTPPRSGQMLLLYLDSHVNHMPSI